MANKEHASAQCKYYDICSRDIEGDPADGLCILHSTDAAKDVGAFTEALAAHRERYGDDFGGFVFPTIANRSYWIPGSWHVRMSYTDDISVPNP
jgi:hypothetical protein